MAPQICANFTSCQAPRHAISLARVPAGAASQAS